ncbi:hypothetical protein [Roseateles sp. BYS87W]|uniref:Lipoprotein n=1 Tax=Pelomonas baiyunensis TaxID=3299026 RepID=A0ABW7H3F7_9BURK
MKRLALALALLGSTALLTGCIIVPHRHGGYRDGYAHGYAQGTHAQPGGTYGNSGGWGPRR